LILIGFRQNIAVLGFAFKADTGDTRESAAITLIRDFLSERARVTVYDPKVEVSQIWFDLSEALPDMPLEQSTPSLSLIILSRLTHLSLSQEAGYDCRLGAFGCAK
jgi:UDP-N-acetyl-D-mannosaminuronate dehydrogenase